MTYLDRLKNLRKVSLAIMILQIASILMALVFLPIEMTSSGDEIGFPFIAAVILPLIILIANFVLWIVSMSQAFELTKAAQYSEEIHGDLTAIKVLSVFNLFTFGIGLFVIVDNTLKNTNKKPMVSNQKIEEIKESPKKATNVEDKIKKMDALLEKGVITKEEHKDLRKQILLKDLEN